MNKGGLLKKPLGDHEIRAVLVLAIFTQRMPFPAFLTLPGKLIQLDA
jgi:hypothetical protein